MRIVLAALVLALGCGAPSTPAPRQPAPKPDYPEVEADVLAARLKSGHWEPSDRTKNEMKDEGIRSAHLTPGLCVDEQGIVTWAEVTEPSAYPPLDEEMLESLRTWTFQPGDAACTTLDVQYEQK